MLKLIRIIIMLLFVQVGFAQSSLLISMDDKGGLTNPITDNLLIDLDFDLATTSGVADQSPNADDMTFFNSPTVNSASLNGFNTVTFNGSNEYGDTPNDIDRTEPSTIYIVFKVLNGTTSGRAFDCITPSQFQGLLNIYSANSLSLYSGTHLISNTATISNWMIVTCVFNGTSSIVKINSGADKSGDAGGNYSAGFRVASQGLTPGGFANIEVARIIMYSAGHNGAERSSIQNYLNTLYKVY